MLCSNAETLDFWNKRRLRNVFHIQCNASEPAAPDSSTRLANSVIQMRWHIWDPSNATVWGLKIQGWNSMAQQLCRMVEGALTHRVGLLVAVSYYGSAVLGRLSSAARPGAVRARLPLRYLPCSSARSRIWSRALAHTVSTAPRCRAPSALPRTPELGIALHRRHSDRAGGGTAPWASLPVSQSSPAVLYQRTRVELAPAWPRSCPVFVPVEVLVPSTGAKSEAQRWQKSLFSTQPV